MWACGFCCLALARMVFDKRLLTVPCLTLPTAILSVMKHDMIHLSPSCLGSNLHIQVLEHLAVAADHEAGVDAEVHIGALEGGHVGAVGQHQQRLQAVVACTSVLVARFESTGVRYAMPSKYDSSVKFKHIKPLSCPASLLIALLAVLLLQH